MSPDPEHNFELRATHQIQHAPLPVKPTKTTANAHSFAFITTTTTNYRQNETEKKNKTKLTKTNLLSSKKVIRRHNLRCLLSGIRFNKY